MIDPFQLNLRHIRAVSAIASARRIVSAAREVGLSQPALTQGLARLECQIGAQLFERQTGGVMATSMGLLMAACSVDLFNHLARALRQRIPPGRGFSEPEKLLTMTQVRAMMALVRNGSFVAASKQSGLSASAICRAVRDIEQLVGVPFTERRGRGIVITQAGVRATWGFQCALSSLQSVLDQIADASAPTPSFQVVGVRTVPCSPSVPTTSAVTRKEFAARLSLPDSVGAHVHKNQDWRSLATDARRACA